jgi:hypothetical protein
MRTMNNKYLHEEKLTLMMCDDIKNRKLAEWKYGFGTKMYGKETLNFLSFAPYV